MKKIFTILIIGFCLMNFTTAIEFEDEYQRLIGSTSPDVIQEPVNQTIELNSSQIAEQETIIEQKRIKNNQAYLFWAILFLIMFGSIAFLVGCSATGSGGARV